MAEGGADLDFFMKQLLKTGIDNYWPKVTYLIVVIKNGDGEVIWNNRYQTSDSHGHTEIQMLNDPKFQDELTNGKVDKAKKVDKAEKVDKDEKVDKAGKVNIILTSNYSPCWECANRLTEFYEDNKGLIREFVIRFSRPYRITRKDDKLNRNGLRYLHKAEITLKAMTEEYWLEVITIEESNFDKVMRSTFDLNPELVRKRDCTARDVLEKVLSQDLEPIYEDDRGKLFKEKLFRIDD